MPTSDRLPENWRGTRRDPQFPDTDLSVTDDGDHVILFDWPNLDAYIRADRDHCVDLDGSDSFDA